MPAPAQEERLVLQRNDVGGTSLHCVLELSSLAGGGSGVFDTRAVLSIFATQRHQTVLAHLKVIRCVLHTSDTADALGAFMLDEEH